MPRWISCSILVAPDPGSRVNFRHAHVRQSIGAVWRTNVWNSYANQTASGIVEVQNAQKSFSVTGTGIVADIDTGVDPNHPCCSQYWYRVYGYDFTRNQAGGSAVKPI